MEKSQSNELPQTFKAMLRDAARYWEPHRVTYNLVLAVIAGAWVVLTWPHFLPAFTLQSLLILLVLALIANAYYSAVYLADIMLQLSFKGAWQRHRWVIWWAGTLLSVLVECYWIADEIYPYVK
jgi:hypothetical protein